MTFWENHADGAITSKISELLQQKAPLERLMEEQSFLDDVYSQKPDLVAFLAQEATIRELLTMVYESSPNSEKNYQKQCANAFYAQTIISNLIPQVTETLTNNKSLLKQFFSIASADDRTHVTPLGYFQSMFRYLVSDLNSLQTQFISAIIKHKDVFLVPLVENLTKSNGEVIKIIFETKKPELEKLQLSLFEYLLFHFLNEKFTDTSRLEERIAILVGIFQFMGEKGIKQKYKEKYIQNLFMDSNIKNKALIEHIFHLKISILNYIVETDQLKYNEHYMKLFTTYESVQKSPKHLLYLFVVLKFFKTISDFNEFK